jgi:hypothetical protein
VVTVTDLANEFGDTFDLDQDALDLATTKVEEHLRRPLRRAVYKERLRIIYDGFNDAIFGAAGAVRPSATPVWSVIAPVPGPIIIDAVEIRYVPADNVMLGFALYQWNEQFATVTYEGGFTHENLPATLRTIILKVAIRLYQRKTGAGVFGPLGIQPGVTGVHVGDVGFSTTGKFGGLFDDSDIDDLRGYRYRGET